MAKRVAVEFTCDRCGAVWSENHDSGKPIPETSSIEIHMQQLDESGLLVDRVVSFSVLCAKCGPTVGTYVNNIDRDPEARKKSKAKKGEVDAEEESASPLPPTTSATPRSGGAPLQTPASGVPARSNAQGTPSSLAGTVFGKS